MDTDTFTLQTSFVEVRRPNRNPIAFSVARDLGTAWEECKVLSREHPGSTVTLVRIGTHSNYGNPLTGTTTTWFAGGNAGDTATRYS